MPTVSGPARDDAGPSSSPSSSVPVPGAGAASASPIRANSLARRHGYGTSPTQARQSQPHPYGALGAPRSPTMALSPPRARPGGSLGSPRGGTFASRLPPLETQGLGSASGAVHGQPWPGPEQEAEDEEATPLFDPSGLSSSLSPSPSASGWGTFDPGSVAAKRLGITAPQMQQNESGSGSGRSTALEASVPELPAPLAVSEQDTLMSAGAEEGPEAARRRGRRRRSSEALPPVDGGTWWTRGSAGEGDTAEASRAPATTTSASASLSRSPAAEFLSSFSRANSVYIPAEQPLVASPAQGPTSAFQGFGAAASSMYGSPFGSPVPPSHRRIHSESPAADPRSKLGYGARQRGASHIGDTMSSPASQQSEALRSDPEGACVGPDSRYLLGRTIAFGGFSTVREAFDLKDEASDRARSISMSPLRDTAEAQTWRRRRLAAKLIYSDASSNFGIGGRNQHAKVSGLDKDRVLAEMELWRDLPIHENILPLIHHERMTLAENDMEKRLQAPAEAAAVDILVMPLCDRGSLLDYVRNEGKVVTGATTPGQAGGRRTSLTMSRTSTLQSNPESNGSAGPTTTASTLAPIIQGVAGVNLESENRSGATTRGAGSRSTSVGGETPAMARSVAGLPPTSGPSSLQALSSAFTSPANSVGAGGYISRVGSLRRTSSRHSSVRSRGLPIASARDVMLQLARGLQILHEKAGVLHADLKLENVLCQARQGASADGQDETIQFLIADFGLAMRPDAAAHSPRALINGEIPRGGSLAYIAPEILRDRSPTEEHASALPSPFAADMWAAGCILYAMFSGKLPFMDPFEPRLQSKIIKGDWEMPPRLRRRGQAAPVSTSSSVHDLMQMKERSQSVAVPPSSSMSGLNRAQSVGHRIASGMSTRHSGWSAFAGDRPWDLSQSLSNLPPGGDTSQSFVVGSAPAPLQPSEQGLDAPDSEPDAESDEDSSIDKAWNGTSAERVRVRKVLRGLLQPDPRKRWDVRQLLASEWLRDAGEETGEQETDEVAPLSFEKKPAREISPERGRGRAPGASQRSSSLSRSRPPPLDRSGLSVSPQEERSDSQESRRPASTRSRSAGRRPIHIDPNQEWSQSIMQQARVGSPSTSSLADRYMLRASASRDSLHFKGFLPMSGASSPAVSTHELTPAVAAGAAQQPRGTPRGSTPIAIGSQTRSGSLSSRSSSAHGPRNAGPGSLAARSYHHDAAEPSSISEDHATRRSTSRSRTRAPDALASILDLDRRERTIAEGGEEAEDAKDADEADERDRERGRARSRSRRR